jgi:nitrogen fixation protein FixH
MSTEPRRITGRTVLIVAVAAFSVVIAANMTMLWAATGSFPGLVVKNSYVASQDFDDRTAAQDAIGWEAAVAHEEGRLLVSITDEAGDAVEGLRVEAVVGRPATNEVDRPLTLRAEPDGLYGAPVELGAGQWRVSLSAADTAGRSYEAMASLYLSARN